MRDRAGRSGRSGQSEPVRPLVVTDDAELLDEVLRLAAAAGVEPEVAADPGAARRAWSRSPLVLVDLAAAVACVAARLPRRSGVLLIADPGSDPWDVATELGASIVMLPDAQDWLADQLADAGRPATAGAAGHAPVLAVAGGRGGAGASVLAAALALTAVRTGRRVLLVDADPLGGGLDLLFAGECAPGARWPDLAGTTGRVSGHRLLAALPVLAGVPVLSWDRGDPTELPVQAACRVLDGGRRVVDLVVCDVSRRVDGVAAAMLQRSARTVLVVPAELRATAAAARVAAAVGRHCADLRLVVRGPAPARLSSRDVGRALGLPVAGALRPEPGLAADLEHGEAPGSRRRGPLAGLCRRLLDDLTAAGNAAA